MKAFLEQWENQLLYRMNISDYNKLGEIGILPEEVELINGFIVLKIPKSPKHTFTVNYLAKVLRNIFESKEYFVQIEQPITTSDSEPEPDISVIKGTEKSFSSEHPTTARLVVEVSLSTYELDFQKQNIYANALISEYWIINLKDNELEVYKNPVSGKYLEKRIYHSADVIQFETTEIILNEFLV
jgi:Uma2 family endonuclease